MYFLFLSSLKIVSFWNIENLKPFIVPQNKPDSWLQTVKASLNSFRNTMRPNYCDKIQKYNNIINSTRAANNGRTKFHVEKLEINFTDKPPIINDWISRSYEGIISQKLEPSWNREISDFKLLSFRVLIRFDNTTPYDYSRYW